MKGREERKEGREGGKDNGEREGATEGGREGKQMGRKQFNRICRRLRTNGTGEVLGMLSLKLFF